MHLLQNKGLSQDALKGASVGRDRASESMLLGVTSTSCDAADHALLQAEVTGPHINVGDRLVSPYKTKIETPLVKPCGRVSVSQDGQFSLWMLIEIRDWSLHVWPGSEESWLIVMLGAGGGHTLGQG